MNPGAFNEKIVLSRCIKTDDGMGGSTTVWRDIAERFASVVSTLGKDGVISGRDLELRTHLVTMRFENSEPQKGDAVKWRGRTLVVKTVKPDYKASIVELDCIEEA